MRELKNRSEMKDGMKVEVTYKGSNTIVGFVNVCDNGSIQCVDGYGKSIGCIYHNEENADSRITILLINDYNVSRNTLTIVTTHEINGVKYTKGHIGATTLEEHEARIKEAQEKLKALHTLTRHYRMAEKRGM